MRNRILPLLLILCACTEKVDLQSRSDYHEYLAVEATLTDRPEDPQRIILPREPSAAARCGNRRWSGTG